MERESFIFYRSFYDSIKGLGDAEFAECMRFLCEYGLNENELEGGVLAEVVLKMAKPQIDANNQRRSNGAKGSRPKTGGSITENQESKKETGGFESENHRLRDAKPNDNDNANGNANANENEKGNENENVSDEQDRPAGPRTFKPPSLEEVQEYCESRQSSVNAERFMDYYTANGWRVGKNSMKDWKAAVRNWERQEAERPENVSGYCRQGASNQKGVSGYAGSESIDAGSEKYSGTVLHCNFTLH